MSGLELMARLERDLLIAQFAFGVSFVVFLWVSGFTLAWFGKGLQRRALRRFGVVGAIACYATATLIPATASAVVSGYSLVRVEQTARLREAMPKGSVSGRIL